MSRRALSPRPSGPDPSSASDAGGLSSLCQGVGHPLRASPNRSGTTFQRPIRRRPGRRSLAGRFLPGQGRGPAPWRGGDGAGLTPLAELHFPARAGCSAPGHSCGCAEVDNAPRAFAPCSSARGLVSGRIVHTQSHERDMNAAQSAGGTDRMVALIQLRRCGARATIPVRMRAALARGSSFPILAWRRAPPTGIYLKGADSPLVLPRSLPENSRAPRTMLCAEGRRPCVFLASRRGRK